MVRTTPTVTPLGGCAGSAAALAVGVIVVAFDRYEAR
jgi:hypothetical protein